MIQAFGAVDVVGVSGRGRGAPVKRLPDLADDKKIIDLPGPQWPENPVPPGRAIAASGPDRRHGIAPLRVLGMSGDRIAHIHGILDADTHPSRDVARASHPGACRLRVYRFFAGGPFWATAAFTSALNAPGSTFSPSWMSIALRILPSKLELKRRDGSGVLAPRANVSFTTFVYASPVQTIPWCDQTGVPLHFHSSVISGSASRISARIRARVSPRHPPRSRIR